MDNPVKVLLVDDHQVVLDGFLARLELEPDIQVVGTACNGFEAIDAIAQAKFWWLAYSFAVEPSHC